MVTGFLNTVLPSLRSIKYKWPSFGQHSMAALAQEQHRRARYVPVMEIALHQLKMPAVCPGLGIQYDDRAGEQIIAWTGCLDEIRSGIAARDVQQSRHRIQ
jgi:hypothetical protein